MSHMLVPSPPHLSPLQLSQANLLAKATAERDSHLTKITEWANFVPALNRWVGRAPSYSRYAVPKNKRVCGGAKCVLGCCVLALFTVLWQ